MVDIRPFKGISYNPRKVPLSSVVSPPYDVISPARQESYYNQDEHNIIRVILGKEYTDDSRINNKYTRARNYIDKWMHEEVLQQADREGIYVYRQTFTIGGSTPGRGKTHAITGIVALVRLEEIGKGNILPHEQTLSAPKLDRLKLMDACEGNLEFIYSLYSDESCQMKEMLSRIPSPARGATPHPSPTGRGGDAVPLVDFKDENGRKQQVWQITDEGQIAQIIEIMKDKPVFIADGHHRYEATYRLKTERSIKDPKSGDKPYDYIMMLLVAMDDPGLIILPTYRLVKGIKDYSIELLLERLGGTFEIIECLREEMFGAIEGERTGHRAQSTEHGDVSGTIESYAFGLYTQSGFYLLKLKAGVALDQLVPDKSIEYQSLDVVVLHCLVVNKLLGDCPDEDNISYAKDADKAIASVDTGEYQLALFLAPAKLSQLKTLSLNREKMPQKSTYFWPKPVSGLLLYLW